MITNFVVAIDIIGIDIVGAWYAIQRRQYNTGVVVCYHIGVTILMLVHFSAAILPCELLSGFYGFEFLK